MNPEQAQAILNCQPVPDRSSSILTLYHDFEAIGIENKWATRQKSRLGYVSLIFLMLFQITFHVFERISLIIIMVGVQGNGGASVKEIMVTISIWFTTMILSILVKMSFQQNISKPDDCCTNQIGGFWNAALLIMKPCKYVRSYFFHRSKLTVLNKYFVEKKPLTGVDFKLLLGINREELIDARDDLHDAFLQRIPMAILQYYYVVSSPCVPNILSLTNCFRILVVIFDITSTIQSTLSYEWKRVVFLDCLHVEGYMFTDGRFKVPRWTKNPVLYLLTAISISTNILSRFFLIGFASSVSVGLGLGCFLVFLIYNWIITSVFPSSVATVENLPLGVPMSVSYFLNRWITAFSGTTTRFSELTKKSLTFLRFSFRAPLVITQVVNFFLAFFLTYGLVVLMEKKSTQMSGLGGASSHLLNGTLNETVCKHAEQWSDSGQYYVSEFISWTLKFFNIISPEPKAYFYNFYHFHWALFYLHVATTLIYNYYLYTGIENNEDTVPPIITLGLYKTMFRKIFEIRQFPICVEKCARMLFLISLDLEHFDKLYLKFSRDNYTSTVPTNRWWNEEILRVVERFEYGPARFRDHAPVIPSLVTLSIGNEINSANAIITDQLEYSLRLYLYCGNRIDDTLKEEMTSYRLDATIEMLDMSKSKLLSSLENKMIGGMLLY